MDLRQVAFATFALSAMSSAQPLHNIQVGFGIGNWVNLHAKYVRSVHSNFFAGLYMERAEPFYFVDSDPDVTPRKITAGAPIEFKWIDEDAFLEIATGIYLTRISRQLRDANSRVFEGEFRYALELPLEFTSGLRWRHWGIALAPSYTFSTSDEKAQLAVRLWVLFGEGTPKS